MSNPVPAPAPANPVSTEIATLELRFKLYWICLAAGSVLSIICIGFAGIIAGIVFYCLLLYRFWELVQPSQRTTPGKAVGFMFIPFFNLYWQFIAYLGLAKELNAARTARGIAGKPINEQMAQIVCILRCCAIIPYLGILAAIAALVMDILTTKDMKDAAIDLIRAGAAPSAAV